MPIHVVRVLKGAKAVRDDFLSDEARGKRIRDASPNAILRSRGFSVWRTEGQARTIAKRFPKLGTHIAEVQLPLGARLLPFPDAADHQTAFGDPDDYLRAIVHIVPVD